MKFSIRIVVSVIVLLLFAASAVALYFVLTQENIIPLTLIASANIVAVIFLTFLITRGVINPLERIQEVVKRVGGGNFKTRIQLSSTREVDQLADAFNDMIGKLEASRAREKQIERMKTEFVSLSAHQLRTPLSEMKWALSMFLDGELGTLTKEQKDYLTKSYSSNERMIKLINDLLNVSRIEEGQYLFKPTLLQIEDIIDSVVQSYQKNAERRGVELVFQRSLKELPNVSVDKEKIVLLLQNLIDNALRYTPKDGRVTVFAKRGTKEVEVSVQDTGVGIPEEQKKRIFERFFRASNARKIDTEGTGLGLYLAKNIAQAHGGRIWFESEEGKGTIFTLALPANTGVKELFKKL